MCKYKDNFNINHLVPNYIILEVFKLLCSYSDNDTAKVWDLKNV